MTYYITETKYNTNCESRYPSIYSFEAGSPDEQLYRLERSVAVDRNASLCDGDITPADMKGDHTAFQVYADEARRELLYEIDFEDTKARLYPNCEIQ